MGVKAKKAMKKSLKKASAQPPALLSGSKTEDVDFLPLEGGPGHKLPVEKPSKSASTVLYIGRIPHGFYEKEIEGYFSQFGTIKRLRIARNKRVRLWKFLLFSNLQVAKIVAETMHNYLLFEHLLQVHLIPPEHVHPKIWKGFNYRYKPLDRVQVQRKNHNKERTLEEHKKLVNGIMQRDKKRRKKIEAAGIDYECPDIVGDTQAVPKKIRFDEE
ncbi:hypothetical protein ACJRO7_028756 [Eucalyptus globulus]|uniref:RRM domain-containing protein n=1 Tax=Eucalyptus globulus TaxID=34317 RepID=A0ABD3JW59_EUCGL